MAASGRRDLLEIRRLRKALLAVAAATALSPVGATAAPTSVLSLEDPAGDATGPGNYLPPQDSQYRSGDFDLRRFEVLVDGNDVVLEITLGAAIRLPEVTRDEDRSATLQFMNGVYLQNVDVYIDTDRTPGSGVSRCIPGRRIAFAGGRTWERAVVVTPQPGLARTIIDKALGSAASRVIVAQGVLARDRTLVVRIPSSALGGLPEPSWGWSVQLSGARREASPESSGAHELDALTMPVVPSPDGFAFGGAPAASRVHPRVVDVILPPGVDQWKVLGSFDMAAGTYARVPFVYGDGSDPLAALGAAPVAATGAPARAGTAAPSVALPDALRPRFGLAARAAPPADAPPATAGWTVAGIEGDVVTLSGPAAGLEPLRVGRVLGPDGAPVARIVVTRLLPEGGAAASVSEGRERVVTGAKVSFDDGR